METAAEGAGKSEVLVGELIGIDDIVVGENYREIDKGEAMKELMASIQTVGLMNPLTVRSNADPTKFDLVAGYRRYHALKMLGVQLVPVRKFMLTDDEAANLRAAENIHRLELNPIQEARAMAELFKRFGGNKEVSSIAKKPVAYVVRALSLLNLPEAVQKLIAAGKLTAEHGHQIMRAPEKTREKLAVFATKENTWNHLYPTVEDLKREIEKSVEHPLRGAAFPKDRPYAEEVACKECPFNSSNQELLFDRAEDGICTGPLCFAKKERTFYKEFAEENKAKYAAMRFLGIGGAPGYDGVFKGQPVFSVEPKDQETGKKLLKEKPEAFGWGIVKAGRFESDRKPKVIFTVTDASVLPKTMQKPDAAGAYDWEKEQFIRKHVVQSLAARIGDAFNGRNPGRKIMEVWALWAVDYQNIDKSTTILSGIYEPQKLVGLNTAQKIKKFMAGIPPDELLKVVWMGTFGSAHDIETNAKAVGIDVKKVSENIIGLAMKAWEDEKKASGEKEKKEVDKPKEKKS
jgi:ParB/RepB/Spo0J family partition protein